MACVGLRSWIAPHACKWAVGLGLLSAGVLPALCSAEIYGWVDQFGNFTYSNLPPPKDARVTDIIPEAPGPSVKAQAEAAHQREMDALNERLQMLELERTRQMQAVDYPSYPAYPGGTPVAAACASTDDYYCDGGPFYFTGGVYRYRPYRGVAGPRFGPPYRGGAHVLRASGSAATHGGGHAR